MPQNPDNVVNPDLVDVADQGDGPLVLEQTVTVGPVQVASSTTQGGTYSPQSPSTSNIIANNVVNQIYGTGTPANVFV